MGEWDGSISVYSLGGASLVGRARFFYYFIPRSMPTANPTRGMAPGSAGDCWRAEPFLFFLPTLPPRSVGGPRPPPSAWSGEKKIRRSGRVPQFKGIEQTKNFAGGP